jgi:choline kinase
MKGLIAAAGLSTRLQDLGDRRNKVRLDLGGVSILSTILTNFENAGVTATLVVVGHDASAVRVECGPRTRLFTTLERHVWAHGIEGYLADILCAVHKKWELAFHLRHDHDRVDVDFPCDRTRARQLYAQHKRLASRRG